MRSDRTGARAGELTAGVNLLPQEIDTERRARRRATLSAIGVVVFIAILGGLYVHKLDQVREAEQARDEAAAEVANLQQELAQLQEFRELADLLDARNAVLADAMSDEVSFARGLNDLALAFPASASMESLDITLIETEVAPEGEGAPVEDGAITFGTPVAQVNYTGYSTERYAPGVETVLIEFDRVSSLFNVYMSDAAEEDRGTATVINFNGTAGMDETARTGRYDDGLPAEVAP